MTEVTGAAKTRSLHLAAAQVERSISPDERNYFFLTRLLRMSRPATVMNVEYVTCVSL